MATVAASAPTEPLALTAPEVVERLLAGLDQAEWHYDAEIDEMELVLSGAFGREAAIPWPLVGDALYVRLDAATSVPLSVIIPAWTWWLGEQGVLPAATLAALPDTSTLPPPARRAAVEALKRTVRKHPEDLAVELASRDE
jgi:hypothetical protein